MIQNYKQLTWKYIKTNKKRAMLSIIGIILSVSLISSIGLFLMGIQEIEKEDIKETIGAHHLQYMNPNQDLVEKIANNPKVDRYGTATIEDTFMLNDEIKISIYSATNHALELLPYQIKEGNFPQGEGEVALADWLLRNIDPSGEIGDKIEINNKEHTLVGILENNIRDQLNDKGTILTTGNHSKDKESILTTGNHSKDKESILLVEISSKTNLKTAVEELSNIDEEVEVMRNEDLIGVQGAGGASRYTELYVVVAVIISIVVISTIAVIYNSFHISVMERIKEFGLLRAVGTTPKQIRKIVLREATLLSLIGIPLGLFFGVVAIYTISFVFRLIGGENLDMFKPIISPLILGGSAIIGLISVYLSAWLPAEFAGKVSPLAAISSRNFIKKEKIKRRQSPLNKVIRKILGFEGELAYKNIKRNRRRYRITVFSILISVMLFITFTSFVEMSFTVTDSVGESENVHFSVVRGMQGTEDNVNIDETILEDIKDLPYVEKIYRVYNDYLFNMEIDKGKEISKLQDFEQEIYRDVDSKDKTGMLGNIDIYDNAALEISQKYVKSGNIDIDKINKENGVILIRKARVFNPNTKNDYYGPTADIKVGDEIFASERLTWDANGEKVDQVGKKLKVVAIVEDDIFNFHGHQGLKLITSEKVAKGLIEQETISPINLNIVLKNEETEKLAIAEIEKVIRENPELEVVNHIDNNRSTKSYILMMKILLYGFVVVVSLIGSVNIINTLTTNIMLRKREFATLRSIGLANKGLRKMIVIEGLLYGVMGIVYGSIIGTILSTILANGIGRVREFIWEVPWSTIGLAAIATLMIGYISVLYPLARIKKDNLIETIREEN